VLLYQFGELLSPTFSLSPVVAQHRPNHQPLQPVGAISMVCIWFIVPSTGLPELTPERVQIAEAKFKRYTLGKWNPSPHSLAFRMALLDYVGSALLLSRAYDLKELFTGRMRTDIIE
jgi:hypothetical protein